MSFCIICLYTHILMRTHIFSRQLKLVIMCFSRREYRFMLVLTLSLETGMLWAVEFIFVVHLTRLPVTIHLIHCV